MIYFIQIGLKGAIKIGFSDNGVEDRLSALQTASPEELNVLGVMEGDQEKERKLHEKFKVLYIRGEWFKPGILLTNYIFKYTSVYTRADIPKEGVDLNRILIGIETRYIFNAISATDTQGEASRLLGISLRSLRHKIKKYDI